MTLLPRWRRSRLENETRFFHALLEADADGDLVVENDDWHGQYISRVLNSSKVIFSPSLLQQVV